MQRKKSAAQTVVWVESRQTASKLPFNSTDSQLMPVMVVIKEEETGVTVPQEIKINKKEETR